MRPGAIIDRLQAQPFRPFQLRFEDGTTIAVPYPHVVVGRDRAVVATEWAGVAPYAVARHWRTVDLARIVGPDEAAG